MMVFKSIGSVQRTWIVRSISSVGERQDKANGHSFTLLIVAYGLGHMNTTASYTDE